MNIAKKTCFVNCRGITFHDGSNQMYVFIDNSNILLGGKLVAASIEQFSPLSEFRICYRNLVSVVCAGRKLRRVIFGGSELPAHFCNQLIREVPCIEIVNSERGRITNTEQSVDPQLQLKVCRCIRDCQPGTLALLTGDGGFLPDLWPAYEAGWGIEIVSWGVCCNQELKRFAERYGVYMPLERYYDSVTYMRRGRVTSRVRRIHPCARPRLPQN